MPPPNVADMDVDNPDLQAFRRQWRREVGLPSTDDHLRRREPSVASSWTLQPTSSEVSTATIRGTPDGSWPPDFDSFLDPDDQMDIDPPQSARRSNFASNEASWVIATDFGTTFSSVAFTKRHLGQTDPQSILNFPDDPRTNGKQSFEVPTESYYPDIARHREFLDETTMTVANGGDAEDLFDNDDDDDEEEPLPYVRHESDNERRGERQRNREREMTIRETVEPGEIKDELTPFLWGYETQAIEAQAMIRFPGMKRGQFKHVARSKLMLDDSERTEKVRDKLRPILNQLKHRGIIRKDEDVIADYLWRLFLHTKEQLILNHGFTNSDPVEHVLCVPNIWSAKACRTMQKTMEVAIRRSGLGSLENLFIVAEPEAAATFVLHNNIHFRIKVRLHHLFPFFYKELTDKPGETFVIIDAGGGTVDATTYTVTNESPLRLKREAVEPTGGLFGSSYLNEGFREYLLEQLKDEDYLYDGESTFDNIIDEAVIDFENRLKRSVNLVENPHDKIKTLLIAKIQGLRKNARKNFYDDHIAVSRSDLIGIFKPLLKKIASLMKGQIRLANDAGLHIQKVILIGGFAGSVTLREYMREKLKLFSSNLDDPIELFAPDSCFETAVSLGAVLRALEKGDGPARMTKSSYGFLRTEHHEPEVFPAHKEVRPTTDKLDGKKYVQNTIDWLVKKGEMLPPHKEYQLRVEHTFPLRAKSFMCEEILYVSDTSTESHYRRGHPKNKGREEAGSIVADMTFLKDRGIIRPTEPEGGLKGKPHYKVEFELVMIIDGRNLRYEARYPAGGEVRGQGQICIAAAFEPGTG